MVKLIKLSLLCWRQLARCKGERERLREKKSERAHPVRVAGLNIPGRYWPVMVLIFKVPARFLAFLFIQIFNKKRSQMAKLLTKRSVLIFPYSLRTDFLV